MKKEVYIIGAGPGRSSSLTREAVSLIRDCKEVYSFDRIANLNSDVRPDINICTYGEITHKVRDSKAESIAVLVSGDTGFFSMANTLISEFEDTCSIRTVCGISSMQYFCAKIGIGYESIKAVSLHGRNRSIIGDVSYNRYVFILTDAVNSVQKICRELCGHMLPGVKVYAGEYLSMDNERIVEGQAHEIAQMHFENLSVLLVENENFTDKGIPLSDGDFIRRKVPMTKEEVRWISVNSLKINSRDIVFDIGAGTGSVAIEMARKAYEGVVYAIEKNADAFKLIEENVKALGACNVIPVMGEASHKIRKLPIPDKVFIGGSGGNLEEIMRYLCAKKPDIRLVVNAITLETLTIASTVFNELDFETSIVCINSARSTEMGAYNLMAANNPVYIISGEKNGKLSKQ